MKFHFSRVSKNAKTGPIPVSTTSKDSCPKACPFKGAGCYAESGKMNIFWSRLSEGTFPNTLDLAGLCAAIKALPAGQLWRHNQAGDLPGDGVNLDLEACASLANANALGKGMKHGFTYTHYPLSSWNLQVLRYMSARGFHVNASANSVEHADELRALAPFVPLVCVLPSSANPEKGAPKSFKTPAGNTISVCPATYREDVTCASCGLCARLGRSCIVGFPAHGNGTKKLDLMLAVKQ